MGHLMNSLCPSFSVKPIKASFSWHRDILEGIQVRGSDPITFSGSGGQVLIFHFYVDKLGAVRPYKQAPRAPSFHRE
jgi:hypothetical protein